MFRRYAVCLIVVPVVLAAWLTFSAKPVVGLPLNQLAMYDFPDQTSEVARADVAEPMNAE